MVELFLWREKALYQGLCQVSSHPAHGIVAVYQRLEPENTIDRIAWLFSDQPQLPEVTTDDYSEEEKAIERARSQAVARVFAEGSLHALLQLAPCSQVPYALGYIAGKSEQTAEITWQHPRCYPWARRCEIGQSG